MFQETPGSPGVFFCYHILLESILSLVFIALIAAYIVVMPTVGIISDLSWHNDQRLAQITLLMVMAVNAALSLTSARRFCVVPAWGLLSRYAWHALFAAFLFGAVSAAAAPLPRWAFVEWCLMVLLITLGVTVAAIRQPLGVKFDRLLIGVLLFTATAYLLKVCAGYTAALVERLPIHIWWLLDGFSNPRFFGQFQTLTLPLLVLPAMFWAKSPLSRVSLTLIPILWWTLSIASGTRGTWLAMIVACAVIFLSARSNSYRWLKWQLGTLLAGLVAYGLFFFVLPSLMSAPVDTVNRLADITNLSFRDVLWARALDYIVAHPVLGIGPMHFAYYPNPVSAHPHMSLLQWAAEWGLPSALLVLSVVLHAGLSSARQLRAIPSEGGAEAYTLQLALFASLCAAAAQSLVDGVIVMPYSQTLLVVLGGWALSIHQCDSPSKTVIVPVAQRIGTLVVALSAALLLWGVFPGIIEIVSGAEAFSANVIREGATLKPRVWSNGWIHD